ncbi:hypothetical protein BDN72DRAFT_413887 [Pluteus cervinus]|uniref:Uncharacterized protein n=1 Tax=Pluteus cervinus TaxID=181527 RepID=A0ACD3A8B9_9AGAR|nr:hypothetical protein BDN72DRAFT_413887 [Pluteus cervinus]
MVQSWTLLNVDKRQTSGQIGKLGEFWASGTDRELLYRLLVPVTDLSTESIGAGISGWAGDRILCVGDNNEDVPDNLLTQAEQDALGGDPLQDYAEGNYQFVLNVVVDAEEKQAAYPVGKTWVLRNLSKMVYVRLDVLDQANCGGVEQVLLCFICWSSDPSCGIEFFEPRGEWAGDRFDINLVEVVEGGDEMWTDVTQNAIDIVQPFWNQYTL